jgi:hypothetical protein
MSDDANESNNGDSGSGSTRKIGVMYVIFILLAITAMVLVGLACKDTTDKAGLVWTLYAVSVLLTLIGAYLLTSFSKIVVIPVLLIITGLWVSTLYLSTPDQGSAETDNDPNKNMRISGYVTVSVMALAGLIASFL